MQNDAASRIKGDGVDQFEKICGVERILRLHQRDTLSCNLCGDLHLGVCFLVKLTCDFAEQANNPFLAWAFLLHFVGDLLLQIKHCCGVPVLHFRMREHEIGVCDDAIHEERDFLEQLAIVDPHPNAAVCIAACPALMDRAFGIDMPEHRRTALSAADTVTDLPDAFAFLNCLIPAPCALDRNGFFVGAFVNDRLEFFIAGVLRILQYP